MNAGVHSRHHAPDKPMENPRGLERRAMHDRSDAAEANPDLGNDVRCDAMMGAGPGLTEMRAGAAPGRMTILLVEDDAPTIYALERLLAALGHEVVTAADGADAWSLLQRRRVHLVLAD